MRDWILMFLCGRQVDDPKYIHEIIQAASGKQYNHEIASRFYVDLIVVAVLMLEY